jgi:putative FmdB family regulatory protein
MPIYTFTCRECDSTTDLRLSVEERDCRIQCSSCDQELERVIQAPRVWAPTRSY